MNENHLKYDRRNFRTINGKRIKISPPKDKRSKTMQKIKQKGTKIEILIEQELIKNLIPYSKPEYIIDDLAGSPDFVVPKFKIAIFCDGDFWHGRDFKKNQIKDNREFWNEKIQSNIERDRLVNDILSNKGWNILRFWESDIKSNMGECMDKLVNMIEEESKNNEEFQFTYIDLFAGIGGFRIPLDELGGKCLGFSEIDKNAIKTYKLNFSDSLIENEDYLGDVTKLNKIGDKEIDLIVGGVPCQAWSVAGKMKGFDDPRGKLWEDTIRVVEINQPKAFIFENVKGLMDPRNKESLNLIIDSLRRLGYNVPKPQLLNSYDFGVPQNRDRIFIVGFRKDLKLKERFSYPEALSLKPRLSDILDFVSSDKVEKKKISVKELHGDKIPFSRNRFQKVDELNDFFIFCDTRNGHTTIHSWDITRTTKREKEICMTFLSNRRKKIYGPQDGNPMSYTDLLDLIDRLKVKELVKLIEKNILKKVNDKYDLVNSKNSSGINDIYRVYLPHSDIFSTLTATGTKDKIALYNVEGTTVEEYKQNFINDIYRKKKFRSLNGREAGRLQGFPKWFAVHEKEDIAKKQFGNAVSVPVIYNLAMSLIKTGVFSDDITRERRDIKEIQRVV